MNLRDTTRDIISLVEDKTGLPVQVVDNPALAGTAVVRFARPGMPAHVIEYKPIQGQAPDYLICYQCGFVLRLFQCLPDQRVQIGSAPTGRQQVQTLMAASLGMSSLPPQFAPAIEQIIGGLLTHLHSTPIGLRIAAWLVDDYPELRELQKQYVPRDLKLSLETLTPEVKAAYPEPIYRATQSINAAHALFWSRRFHQPSLVQPYTQAGYRRAGGELLDIWDQAPQEPAHDRELVDRWAEHLGLTGWYQWVPYRPPQ